ncbi:MAG: hypothetical protein WD771_03170 [Gemmatimonadaceae bacterium]
MGLWEKVQQELDRAGTVAKGALDEGKIRIELFRIRQQADKAAQALGYAVHRAKKDGKDLEEETFERLHQGLKEHEAEAKRLEGELAVVLRRDATDPPKEPPREPPNDPPADGQPPTPPSEPAASA